MNKQLIFSLKQKLYFLALSDESSRSKDPKKSRNKHPSAPVVNLK